MSEHDPREDYDEALKDASTAPEPLLGYAKLLWVFGWVQAVATGIGLMFGVGSFVSALIDRQWGKYRPPDLYWMLALIVVGAGSNALMMWGVAGMRKCRGYRRSVLAAVLAAASLPCFYLGVITVPIGLLALRQLIRPDVRARFAAVARGKMTSAPPEATDARTDGPS